MYVGLVDVKDGASSDIESECGTQEWNVDVERGSGTVRGYGMWVWYTDMVPVRENGTRPPSPAPRPVFVVVGTGGRVTVVLVLAAYRCAAYLVVALFVLSISARRGVRFWKGSRGQVSMGQCSIRALPPTYL